MLRRTSQAELLELVASDGLTRGQLADLYASLAGVPYQAPACVSGEEMFTDVPAAKLETTSLRPGTK